MAGSIDYDKVNARISAAIGGDSWVRGWEIVGLENGPSHAALAVEAFDLIPNKGSAVPSPLTGMTLDDATIARIWPDPANPGTWRASGTITYRSPTPTTVGIEVPDANGPGLVQSTEITLEEYETDVDAAGNQVITVYDGEVQAHRVTAYRTVTTHTFARPEDQNPRGRVDTYQGKVNSGVWNGYASETVLCQSIRHDTTDNQSWTVRYVFVVKPDGFPIRVVHEDPYYPGQPIPLTTIPPAEQPAAQAGLMPFDSISFAGLNITL